MARRGNNAIPGNHFRKHWQRRIKTWFNQPARKVRRSQARIAKLKSVAPRPAGLLRPAVRCPSIRYNSKVRLGRGFTLEELKGAGIPVSEAKQFGIAVDYRRTNRSVESIERNVQRLKEYKSRLIVFPKKTNKPKKGDSSEAELKLAQQLRGIVLPLKKTQPRIKAQPITDELKKFAVYNKLRQVRGEQRNKGKREKAAKAAAEEGLGGGRR
ncbi:60S ribosomal protein L13 [Aphelenchoides besseyi]|nr:60S ribosomal protein L13 [Aphelenchoides besseyi]KAI6217307.1 60S ribosomal protein L13 [Aphelenchoides besseyi]